MWLIVGLGNPGDKYARTRHNIGFRILDELAGRMRLQWRDRADYRMCTGAFGDAKIVLLEPLTFMNRSGSAVQRIAKKFFIEPEHIIVVHDDLDLETGRLKIRRNGSSGGHKGVESVIQCIGSKDFIRVKIGIGRDEAIAAERYVLMRFGKDEAPVIGDAIRKAADSVEAIIAEGPDRAMNRYNS